MRIKELKSNDLEEFEIIAKSIPKIIKAFIKETKIPSNVAQINMIQRFFLGICSAESFKFRKGDIVLTLEIAQFVRSKFACAENPDGFSFFENADEMNITPHIKTIVGVLFCDSTYTKDNQENSTKENGRDPRKSVLLKSIEPTARPNHDSSSRTAGSKSRNDRYEFCEKNSHRQLFGANQENPA